MAGGTNNARYRTNQTKYDPKMNLDIVKSVLELRGIYNNLTDREFAAYYSKKYKIKQEIVFSILDNRK